MPPGKYKCPQCGNGCMKPEGCWRHNKDGGWRQANKRANKKMFEKKKLERGNDYKQKKNSRNGTSNQSTNGS